MIQMKLDSASNVSDKRVLVIEDMAAMRSQLQGALSSVGFQTLHVVSSVKDGLQRLENSSYDLILCDYFLRDGTTGQQFLEYLRTRDILQRNTLFIMITAENSYDNVVSAAECQPDDYLLRPFSINDFMSRLSRLLVKQAAFSKIDAAYDKKNWHGVIAACNALSAAKSPYLLDILKIKAAALLRVDKFEEALAIYKQVAEARDQPWAYLGIARALAGMNKVDEAVEVAQNLLNSHPKFVAAYDFLSELMLKANKPEAALEVLQSATLINPSSLNRSRQLSSLAMSSGKHDLAEEIISKTLKRHQNSPAKEASDFALLSRALGEQSKMDEAFRVLKSAGQLFSDPHSEMVIAASASLNHRKAGNHQAAETELNKALANEDIHLPPDVVSMLAEACFAAGKEDVANKLIKQMLQNNPNDLRIESKVKMTFAMAGKSMSESSELIAESEREVIKINNDGVKKAQEGNYQAAIDLIVSAAERLPNNPQIFSNAALILAAALAEHKYDDELMRKCLIYRQRMFEKDPQGEKLAKVDMLLRKVKAAA